MWRLTLLLLFQHTLAQFFDQEKCVIDYRSLENMWEVKLARDINNCSNPYKPPAQNGTEPLIVKLKFFMSYFIFDSEAQHFSTLTWVMFSWEDERLKWDPKKYEGIDKIPSSTDRIWAPEIRLINNIDDFYDFRYIYIPCELNSSGLVRCVARMDFKVKCIVDLRDWPYDAQYCKMEFGTHSNIVPKIQFDIRRKAMEINERGAEWNIEDYQQILNETSEKQVILKFRLVRHTEGLAAIVIYPSLVLTALTLSSLFLDGRLNYRLLLVCFSLLCHFYFLTDLTWQFPQNTKDQPNLLMYYRGSFILTSILIVLSFALNVICKKDVVCPNWIISVNDFVSTKIVNILVLPRWETKIEYGARNFVKDWTYFANIINAFSILVSVVVYVCLYCVFMPQQNSFS